MVEQLKPQVSDQVQLREALDNLQKINSSISATMHTQIKLT
jgi:hypothetical protein